MGNSSVPFSTWASSGALIPSLLRPASFLSLIFKLSTWIYILPLYLVTVRLLRYRRRYSIVASFNYTKRADLAAMTMLQAADIYMRVSQLEFPFMFVKALQFALFRTYGITTISGLLHATTQLSHPDTAFKRYTDTDVLITEFTGREWGGPQWVEAISRMNCIHKVYQDKGKILMPDLTYTLALFAREPGRWIDQWEWRTLSDVERCAIGVMWKSIGDAMNISWAGLPGHDSGKGWTDGLHWVDEISAWAEKYEEQAMVPHETNAKVAEQTTNILLWYVPTAMKPVGKQAVSALMDTRLRRAMLYPDPSPLVAVAVPTLLSFRRFVLRHLALPRPSFLRAFRKTDEISRQGTYFFTTYPAKPYYIKPTLLNRWGPSSWIARLQGLPLPGDNGNSFYPGGYKIRDVGSNVGKAGQAEMEKTMREVGKRSCLFSLPSHGS